jgi:hypothetical protein
MRAVQEDSICAVKRLEKYVLVHSRIAQKEVSDIGALPRVPTAMHPRPGDAVLKHHTRMSGPASVLLPRHNFTSYSSDDLIVTEVCVCRAVTAFPTQLDFVVGVCNHFDELLALIHSIAFVIERHNEVGVVCAIIQTRTTTVTVPVCDDVMRQRRAQHVPNKVI